MTVIYMRFGIYACMYVCVFFIKNTLLSFYVFLHGYMVSLIVHWCFAHTLHAEL